MRRDKVSLYLSITILIIVSLLFYACSSDSTSSSDTTIAEPPPMEISPAMSQEVDDTMDLLVMNDFIDMFENLVDLGTITSSGSNASLDVSRVLRVLPGCPDVTINYTGEFTVNNGFLVFPSPYEITVDYGTTGCEPMTGSFVFTLTNFKVSSSVVKGGYSLVVNQLITDNTTVSGSVSGNINITVNSTTGTGTGYFSGNFNNFNDGVNTIDGRITISFEYDASGDFETVTFTFNDFSSSEGGESVAGHISVTVNNSTDYTWDIDVRTATRHLDMTLSVVVDDVAGTMTINTVGPGNYTGLTIEITDMVIADSCELEPVSGTVVWTNEDGGTAIINFDGVCDGIITVEISSAIP